MSLEWLPCELLLQVLASLPDLDTLDNLLRASPTSYRLFDSSSKRAVDVTESILETGRVCDHIQTLLRQVALLRSGGARPFPPGYTTEYAPSRPVPPGVASFRRQVVEESLRHGSRRGASEAGFVPRRLEAGTAPRVLRSILVTARRITAVSLDCLAHYAGNLDEFLADEAAAAAGHIKPARCLAAAAPLPPAWTEEQRCARTLWRLQLIFDLKQAARSGTLGWPRKELRSLEGIAAIGPPEDDWWLGLQVSRFSQLWPSAGCEERFFYHAVAHHDCHYPDVPHPEKHEHATVMEYVRHVHGHDVALRMNQGLVPPTTLAGRREVCRPTLAPEPAAKDHRQLVYASAVIRYYESVRPAVGGGGGDDRGRWRCPDIAQLRRAGFALWSNQRLGMFKGCSDP